MNIKDIENIRELIQLMGDSDVSEIAIEDGDVKLTLKREKAPATHEVVVQAPAAPAAVAAPAATPATPAAPAAAAPAEDDQHYITAPLVGTFYSSPSPDQAAYASVGDHVKKGQVICIIEAMKLMNEIESDVDGTITEVLVQNANPVDYGAKIYAIKPD